MPGRLGPRFALEAGFLIALAVAAGVADLRPQLIVLVMAIAWLLVALIEFAADRLNAAGPTWRRAALAPARERPAEPPRSVAAPAREPDSATVVAPPPAPVGEADVDDDHARAIDADAPSATPGVAAEAQPPDPVRNEAERPEPLAAEAEAADAAPPDDADEPEAEAGVENAADEPRAEAADDDEAEDEPAPQSFEPPEPRVPRRWFWRRGRRDADDERGARAHAPPRHVRLLPPAPRRSRASDEVAEIFDSPGDDPRETRP